MVIFESWRESREKGLKEKKQMEKWELDRMYIDLPTKYVISLTEIQFNAVAESDAINKYSM